MIHKELFDTMQRKTPKLILTSGKNIKQSKISTIATMFANSDFRLLAGFAFDIQNSKLEFQKIIGFSRRHKGNVVPLITSAVLNRMDQAIENERVKWVGSKCTLAIPRKLI